MIVSASAARTAPAAKARGNESVSWVARDNGPAPITTAKISRTAQRVHVPQDESLIAALFAHRGAPHQRFGEIGGEDGRQERNAAATFPKSDAEHEIFWNSVKGGGGQQSQTGGAADSCGRGGGVLRRCIEVQLLTAMIIFPVAFCHPVQQQADHGKDDCPDRQAECRSPNVSLLVGILEHLKDEGRDECFGGEGKHRRKHPLWELESPANRAPSTKALEAIAPKRIACPMSRGYHLS